MSSVPFVESPIEVVKRMLEMAGVRLGEVVYDLGSGDGRVVMMAAREFGARAVGFELRDDLVKRSREEIRRLRLEERAEIVQGDLFQADVGKADVVTMYLNSTTNERLRPKLERELREGARVVSHDFEIVGWKPAAVSHDPQGHTIYLYKFQRKR